MKPWLLDYGCKCEGLPSPKHLNVHWKDWWSWNSNTLATWCEELTYWKRPWCWERLRARGEGDDRGWDSWMASPTQWTWVWVNSRSWWWTGRPGMLWFTGLTELLSSVWLFVTPWIAARQASLSITKSQRPPKPMSIESVIPSNYLILCHLLLLLPSILPSIRVFSNESALCIKWPKYWNFSFNISPFSEHPGLISFRMDWLGLLAVQGTLN